MQRLFTDAGLTTKNNNDSIRLLKIVSSIATTSAPTDDTEVGSERNEESPEPSADPSGKESDISEVEYVIPAKSKGNQEERDYVIYPAGFPDSADTAAARALADSVAKAKEAAETAARLHADTEGVVLADAEARAQTEAKLDETLEDIEKANAKLEELMRKTEDLQLEKKNALSDSIDGLKQKSKNLLKDVENKAENSENARQAKFEELKNAMEKVTGEARDGERERVASELERVDNELERVDNEAKRVANEAKRVAGEEGRVRMEAIRVARMKAFPASPAITEYTAPKPEVVPVEDAQPLESGHVFIPLLPETESETVPNRHSVACTVLPKKHCKKHCKKCCKAQEAGRVLAESVIDVENPPNCCDAEITSPNRPSLNDKPENPSNLSNVNNLTPLYSNPIIHDKKKCYYCAYSTVEPSSKKETITISWNVCPRKAKHAILQH